MIGEPAPPKPPKIEIITLATFAKEIVRHPKVVKRWLSQEAARAALESKG